MVRNGFLLVAVIAAASSIVTLPSSVSSLSGCGPLEAFDGTCNVSGNINGNGVDLSGHKDGSGSDQGPSKKGSGKKKPPAPTCVGLPAACDKFIVIAPGAPGNPTLSINDLRNFPANPGTDHMEPSGWMIVGLDTNFYSVVGTEIVNGTLLGQPATVRFTPIAWHWTYGDGTGATRATPGTTWAAQGIPEFDPTATSHVYSNAGTYYIDLSITFRAEYKYATGNWTPVTGTITLPANRLKATAGDAKTVLVGRDCTENPGGPGC